MTAAWLLRSTSPDGLQPVDLSRHLAGIAELIELCFSAELDAGARGLIREMRWLSRAGPALGLAQWLLASQPSWNLGFVWVDAGRVVGTVSTQRTASRSTAWQVANVAVHPAHRRRGIAAALMHATLDYIRRQGGTEAILQVDDSNLGAITLYRDLGFARVTTQTTWHRPAHLAPPPLAPLAAPLEIRPRAPGEWAAQHALAALVRPEGLAWGRPLSPADFRGGFTRWLEQWLIGRVPEHWIAAAPSATGGERVVGAVTVQPGGPDGDRLVLLVHPDYRGELEQPLLARGLRRLGRRPWSARVEHAGDDAGASQALHALGFQPRRTLRWMRLDLHRASQPGP